MKKLITLLLVFVVAFSVFACTKKVDDSGKNENNGGIENQGGNGGNGGNNGGETQKQGVLETLGNNYKIDLSYSNKRLGDLVIERELFMAGDGAYLYTYFDTEYDSERTILVKNEHCYSFNEYADLFHSCTANNIEDNVEDYDGWTKLIRISENAKKIEFTGQENTTYLNRPCTKYINKQRVKNDFYNYDVDAYYIVDNATKLCLKYDNTTINYNEQGAILSQGKENFEVTEFAVGSVNMSSTIAKIKFEEWVDGSYFASRGLTNVTAPNGTFVRYYLSTDEEDKNITKYDATYIMSEANAKALCNAFYNAGVKYDYDDYSTVKPIEQIYQEATDEDGTPVDGYITFYGYTSKGEYVSISGEKLDDGNYEIEISV